MLLLLLFLLVGRLGLCDLYEPGLVGRERARDGEQDERAQGGSADLHSSVLRKGVGDGVECEVRGELQTIARQIDPD
jgi:hypothetical protein